MVEGGIAGEVRIEKKEAARHATVHANDGIVLKRPQGAGAELYPKLLPQLPDFKAG
jgi:hypothetical protein